MHPKLIITCTLLTACALLAACGNKGSLVLPPKSVAGQEKLVAKPPVQPVNPADNNSAPSAAAPQ